MTRALAASLLSLCLVGAGLVTSACNKTAEPSPDPVVAATGGKGSGSGGKGDPAGGAGGSSSTGGTAGSAAGGSGGSSPGGAGGSGPAPGTGGEAAAGSGGASASGGAGGTGAGGAADAAVTVDVGISPTDAGAGDANPLLSMGDQYMDRPIVRLCKKDWTHEQCCTFLCACLNSICTDAPKAKMGPQTCGTWCPKLDNMAMRCHVFHCFESISPGGVKDHDSHCGHAANEVGGGGCDKSIYTP